MTFFRNSDDDKSKRRVTFGDLFNPRFGNDIRPMGDAIKMFVHLIAYIFATNGMFPRNHPALSNDPSVRLTMAEVLRTAWQHVEFTREGLIKTVVFFAVAGTLAFTALFILIAVLSLFVGKAHAQSMFVPSEPDNDWGLSWINYIFLGKKMDFLGTGNTSGVSAICDWQKALGTGLGYYSAGMLVLAGVILLYQLMKMVAETAHTGKPMGSANQIWAPIRLVVAIGLLVPIGATVGSSTCGDGTGVVTGLNSGQYIVIQMARWGSGLATNVWQKFIAGLETKTPSLDCSDPATLAQSPSCVHVPSSQVRAFVLGMISNYACVYIHNYYVDQLSLSVDDKVGLIGSTNYFGNKTTGGQKLCGGFAHIDTAKVSSAYKSVYEAQMNVVNSFILGGQFKNAALATIPWFVEPNPTNTRPPKDLLIDSYVDSFQTQIDAATNAAIQAVDSGSGSANDAASDPIFSKGGWLAAGTWFNTIVRLQAQRADSIEGGLPNIIPPTLFTEAGKKIVVVDKSSVGDIEQGWEHAEESAHEAGSLVQKTAETLKKYNAWLTSGGSSISALETAAQKGIETGTTGESFMNKVLGLVNWAAVSSGTWSEESGQLGIKFDKTRNPLAEVAALGQNILKMAFTLFGMAAAAYGIAGAAALFGSFLPFISGIVNAVGTLGGSILISIGSVLLMPGVLLGYFLPLVPFIRFFFAAMTWIIGVAEALVAAPLLALAHLNPEGAGLPGQQARQGYYFIVNVFLRPTLMIFGLIAGYLLFSVGIAFLNTMFIVAAKGTGTFTGELPIMAKLIYTGMYCGFAYVLGQNCFKAIGMFPEHALRWLGSGGHLERMGDHHTVMGAMTGAAGALITHSALQSALQAPKQLGDAAGGAMKGKRDLNLANQEKLGAAKTAQQNQDQLMGAQGFTNKVSDLSSRKEGYLNPDTGRMLDKDGNQM